MGSSVCESEVQHYVDMDLEVFDLPGPIAPFLHMGGQGQRQYEAPTQQTVTSGRVIGP